MTMNDYNNLIKIMLNLADLADEKQETPFDHEMGLGYRAFTSYVRAGVQKMVKLKSDYYSACESRDYAKNALKDNEDTLKKIFGRPDLDVYNDDELARFKELAEEIQKEIDKEIEE